MDLKVKILIGMILVVGILLVSSWWFLVQEKTEKLPTKAELKACSTDSDCILVETIKGLDYIPTTDKECGCLCVTSINKRFKDLWEEKRKELANTKCELICKPCTFTINNSIAKCKKGQCVVELSKIPKEISQREALNIANQILKSKCNLSFENIQEVNLSRVKGELWALATRGICREGERYNYSKIWEARKTIVKDGKYISLRALIGITGEFKCIYAYQPDTGITTLSEICGGCEEIKIYGGGGDEINVCLFPDFEKEFICFKRLKYYGHEASKCKLLGTECYRRPMMLGMDMDCIFICCPKLESKLFLKYHFDSETSYEDITITQSKLIYTYFPADIAKEKCRNWSQSYPCWKEDELKTVEISLSEKEEKDLIEFINKTNFFELSKTFYGNLTAPRYYEHRLFIKIDGKEKDVVYFASPNAPPMPEELRKIKDRLFELLDRKWIR